MPEPVPRPVTTAIPTDGQALTNAQKRAAGRQKQEQQRAAKAAAQKQQSGQSGPTSSSKSAKGPATPNKKSAFDKASSSGTPSKDAGSSHSREIGPGVDGAAEGPKARGLRIFSHFGIPASTKAHQIKGDIHPAIVKLGLQFSEFKICGANARCIATLTAFKTVIQDYVTPPHNTLSRHLMTHLSPQITHLVNARPMSVTMGNAIRQLKLEISGSDIDLPEQDAKDALCQKIDNYIRDRIIIADEVIEDLAVKKIKDGDVVLTYARSSLVEKILLRAHSLGKRLSVISIDSRPLLEGKTLLHTLTSVVPPIPCTYALLPALPSLINEADIVFLGAHSLHANGSVYSRAGTAMVALLAKEHSVPVVVCCETYKFSEGVMLDSFGKNELAPSKFSPSLSSSNLKSNSNLEILNPLYDSTPASCITAVVTEVGLIPPTSISSIPLALGKTTL
ncbi:hypothetical protein GYMLUDRAFT_39047 [Collybiopsis luxurians FD-317 M1]|nr:hypothetical protein GYMLUDRAFT_39047 [Collybiopsis luxurians FD-317 M1]